MSRIFPILFNTEMVKAILENRKTVTRRLIKREIKPNQEINLNGKGQFEIYNVTPGCGIPQGIILKLPYGPGDILYVRETWQFMPCIECNKCENCEKESDTYSDKESISEGCFIYRADYPQPERINWKPSIHMPKEAARIRLKVIDIRAERLQDITIDGIIKEGCAGLWADEAKSMRLAEAAGKKNQFTDIWNSTIKKTALPFYGWGANPYVWVIEFEQCGKPEREDKTDGKQ